MQESRPSGSHAFTPIFWAGATCGVLDISAAFVTWAIRGVKPVVILQAIASGLLGQKSFSEGWPSAILGLGCHFFIAYAAASVYYVASRKIAFMITRAISAGILYGVAVYVVMYWIVKPLSLVQPRPFSWRENIVAIITHMVCVGLPIALMVRRFSKSN